MFFNRDDEVFSIKRYDKSTIKLQKGDKVRLTKSFLGGNPRKIGTVIEIDTKIFTTIIVDFGKCYSRFPVYGKFLDYIEKIEE